MKAWIKEDARYIFLVLTLIALGSFFRLFHLDRLSYWYDELFAIVASSKSFTGFVETMMTETNPPLFQFLLWIWIQVFGNSQFSGRLFVASLSIVSLPLLFRFAYLNSNRHVALSFLTFLVFSSGAIYYSQEVRSYTLLILFSGVAYFIWLGILKGSNAKKTLFLFFLVSLLCSFTHYFGFIIINLMWLYLLLVIYLFRAQAKSFPIFLYILLNFFYLPEVYKLLFYIPKLNTVQWIPKPNLEIYIHFFSYIFYFISYKRIPILILFLISLVLPFFNFRKFKLSFYSIETFRSIYVTSLYIIISLLISTFLISQNRPMVTSRNLLVLLIPTYFLISYWYSSSNLFSGYRQNLLVFFLIFLSCLSFSKYYYKDFLKEPWREVTQMAVELTDDKSYITCFHLIDYYNYYLVDIYKKDPLVVLENSEIGIRNLIEKMKTNRKTNLIVLESSWDKNNEEEYLQQSKNIEILKKKAKIWEEKSYLGFQIFHFKF